MERGRHGEFGRASLVFDTNVTVSLLGEIVRGDPHVWMSHSDHVVELPPNMVCTARSGDGVIAMARPAEGAQSKYYGVQYHPEVQHTVRGREMLACFARQICGCEQDWTTEGHVERIKSGIAESVGRGDAGGEHLIVGLSGGVDSLVAATLVSQVVGKRLYAVLVDLGLLRYKEVEQVVQVAASQGMELHVLDRKEQAMRQLQGVTDAEEKRKVIGELFVRAFEEFAAQRSPQPAWLVQGTIYSDVIESAGSGAGSHKIKSHHNVGGLPEKMNLKLLEPLRDLFKNEVRQLGLELGLPADIINRHPFPGPGLGVRIIGEVNAQRVEILQHADHIFMQELETTGFYEQSQQAFAVLIPVRTTSVLGDARQYGMVIALRAVATTDFMTADWVDIPHEILSRTATRIVNEVHDISRVVYDITSKPPGTIEWE